MGVIRADVAGLSVLADSCDAHAGLVGGVGSPLVAGRAFQATAAQVIVARADVAALRARFSARMWATSDDFTAAARGYATTETASATALSVTEL